MNISNLRPKARQSLPQFIVDMLASPPRTGEGVHVFLFKIARQLHAHLPAGEIVELLERCTADCGRHVPRSEIVAAVQNALACAWQAGARVPAGYAVPKWPNVDEQRRAEIIAVSGDLSDVWELSDPRLDDDRLLTEAIIGRLFPGNLLLCCGKSMCDFDTKPRDDWRGQLSALQFIVPSPMSAITGKTKDGRESKHTLSNTGARRFLVIEFDQGDVDQHAGLLIHLGGYAPPVCVVHSGNKSLHGWFYVAGEPEERIERFFRYAVSLGADRVTWTPSQFCRMPDGLRSNGARQRVFFVRFHSLEVSQECMTR